jgi:hypothetical protein
LHGFRAKRFGVRRLGAAFGFGLSNNHSQLATHHEAHEGQGDFELGNQEPGNRIFEIEGKGAMGSAERVGR